MRTTDFDYELPPELIAQTPAERRDASRLLVLDRASGQIEHRQFPDLLAQLRSGDVLVLNNSRVIPARLRGLNEKTGGQFEVLLLEENAANDWWVMLRPGKRARMGTRIIFLDHAHERTQLIGEVIATNDEGHRRIKFSGVENVLSATSDIGELPLPPYIERSAGATSAQDRERYQTVFAKPLGSVAAPTAGLHFTPELLDAARAKGVRVEFVTLHVGLGTFAPVKADNITDHVMHEERFEVSEATATHVNTAKQSGHRIIAVGTTSMRVLESVARNHGGKLIAGCGRTSIFIHPPQRFALVDALLTNFHLPRSTLLMLVSAFASPGTLQGRELALRAYAEAVGERYRFFSYGDAMFIA
jgi:S-adenosylmethionine:tRNA ribosyltransferase-isomerase